MYIGFNLRIDENAEIFDGLENYERLQHVGQEHLNNQKALFNEELEDYVVADRINGTKIQDEWFPQIEADVFISHSGKDGELANALAGWIYETFRLRCFIDANVWGYSKTLLERMNSKLSNKRRNTNGGYLYDHESCNRVSQHVNMMLSIALQKMIDKAETIILLNTDNSVTVCSDSHMEETYSPWIYAEISCTQFVRKKPLLAYRDYGTVYKEYFGVTESVQFAMHSAISYTVSLKHLKPLDEDNLLEWRRECFANSQNYEYKLDALYQIIGSDEVQNTRKLFGVLTDEEIRTLKQAYLTQDVSDKECENVQSVWERIVLNGLRYCQECDRFAKLRE